MTDMEIRLIKNRGYRWSHNGYDSFKGYFHYDGDDTIYREATALAELAKVCDYDGLKDFLRRIDGVYAIVLRRGEEYVFAVDRARTMPLFYSTDGRVLSDSCEEARKTVNISADCVALPYAMEMYNSDIITGQNTIYSELKQLDGGQLGKVSGGVVRMEYYYYNYAEELLADDKTVLRQKLTACIDTVGQRLSTVIAGRPVALSLSGGYDSKLVACMLKKAGVTDVSCFSYGKPDSPQTLESRKTAAALGFRWCNVEMTDELVCDMMDDVAQEYFDYCDTHDYTAYIQNYAAIKYLHDTGWFKQDSVQLTGILSDIASGEYIFTEAETKAWTFDAETLARHILFGSVGHLHRYATPKPYCDQFLEELRRRILELPFAVVDYQTFWSAYESLMVLREHSRIYFQMNRVNEFFGYEWLVPLYDKEFVQLLYSIPAQIRAKRELYVEWLINDIYSQYNLASKSVDRGFYTGYSVNKTLDNLIHAVGGCLAFVTLHAGIPLRRKIDQNNHALLEPILFRKIRYKGRIKYGKAGFTCLLNRYLMEQRYGSGVIKQVSEILH